MWHSHSLVLVQPVSVALPIIINELILLKQCLSSTTAFGFGSQYLARYEIQMVGISWKNIRDSPIQGDEMSFHWCLVMMALDGVIYLVIGWYIRNVKPGDYLIQSKSDCFRYI